MVIIYTTETCPRCSVLKTKLQSKNIKYIENHDIDEMRKLGIMSVPYMMMDGQLMNFGEAISWVNAQ